MRATGGRTLCESLRRSASKTSRSRASPTRWESSASMDSSSWSPSRDPDRTVLWSTRASTLARRTSRCRSCKNSGGAKDEREAFTRSRWTRSERACARRRNSLRSTTRGTFRGGKPLLHGRRSDSLGARAFEPRASVARGPKGSPLSDPPAGAARPGRRSRPGLPPPQRKDSRRLPSRRPWTEARTSRWTSRGERFALILTNP